MDATRQRPGPRLRRNTRRIRLQSLIRLRRIV